MRDLALTRRWLLAVIGVEALLALIGLLWLLGGSDGALDGDSSPPDLAEDTQHRPALAAQSGSSRSASNDRKGGGDSTPATEPTKTSPRKPVSARLELVTRSGIVEPIEISHVVYQGNILRGSDLRAGHRIPVMPGGLIWLRTSDPRAAMSGVGVRIADPVPDVIVGQVSFADDPRLSTIVVEVVDAKTGTPIRDATLTIEEDDRALPPSDPDGRIVLTSDGRPYAKPSLLAWWHNASWSVHAKGYRSTAPRMGVWTTRESSDGCVRETEIRDWLDRGKIRVPLDPLGDDWHERVVRFVDSQGRAAPGILVVASGTAPVAPRGEIATSGVMRSDAGGIVSFPFPDECHVIGLDLFRGADPIAAFVLAAGGWSTSQPREVRLPELAEVELVLDGAPTDTPIHYSGDLGDASTRRSLGFRPVFPLTIEPEARRLGEENRDLVSYAGYVEIRGELPSGEHTIRFPMPIHTTKTVWIGDELRYTSVEATSPGPLRVVRRWDELKQGDGEIR